MDQNQKEKIQQKLINANRLNIFKDVWDELKIELEQNAKKILYTSSQLEDLLLAKATFQVIEKLDKTIQIVLMEGQKAYKIQNKAQQGTLEKE